jgi:hypothetical protein
LERDPVKKTPKKTNSGQTAPLFQIANGLFGQSMEVEFHSKRQRFKPELLRLARAFLSPPMIHVSYVQRTDVRF